MQIATSGTAQRILFRSVVLSLFLFQAIVVVPASANVATAQDGKYDTDYAACPPGFDVPSDTVIDRDLEVSLNLDTSGSMEGSRFSDAKSASKQFVGRLQSDDEAALVSFSGSATVEENLTTDHDELNTSIDNTDILKTGTNIASSIRTAEDELFGGENATSNATKVMIILSDGTTIDQEDKDEATEAKDNGTIIYTIAVGESADTQGMEDIATGDRFFEAPNSSELDAIYDQISTDIEEDSAGTLKVETNSLFYPGEEKPYKVYENVSTATGHKLVDVTDNATVTSLNTSLMTVNQTSHTLKARDDPNESSWVRIDAEYQGQFGCANVVISRPDVDDLRLLPGIWRFVAVFEDSTLFALMIAGLIGLAASRFVGSFAGLASAQMVVAFGWLSGYIATNIAALSVFVAMFIGLNLAQNTEFIGRSGIR